MPKPTFEPRTKQGATMPPEPYTPLIFIAGTETYRLALHKQVGTLLPDSRRQWVVSDPKSGGQILTVRGTYKGVPCSSAGMPLTQARNLAMSQLDELVERVGSDRFNAVLSKPPTKQV